MAGYRRRLRRVLIDVAARFVEVNPQWAEYFFDLQFLLTRGLPIIERHLAGDTSNGAIELALAWAEEWPFMNASQRKACLQAQTVMAAELLRLVTEAMFLPHPEEQDSVQARDKSWRGMGIPLAYVQAHNPPGRSGAHQQQPVETVEQHQSELAHEEKGLHLPTLAG